jgi:hypothetical protein
MRVPRISHISLLASPKSLNSQKDHLFRNGGSWGRKNFGRIEHLNAAIANGEE